jgi:hypothetical protein
MLECWKELHIDLWEGLEDWGIMELMVVVASVGIAIVDAEGTRSRGRSARG